MPTSYDDRLKDYVDVKTRVAEFYAQHPDGRLVTAEAYMTEDADGKVRVWAKALAYRTPDDPLPGVGHSYLEVPGSTPYTRGSEIENAETSAWGRAIGALGIGISKSIATTDEIDAKAGEADRKPPIKVLTAPDKDPGGLTGIAEVGTAGAKTDFELRQTPDGMQLGFRLIDVNGKGRYKVIAKGALAEAIKLNELAVIDQRVTVWGRIGEESFTAKNGREITVPVVDLERIKAPLLELPKAEAESIPLPLTDDEKAAIAKGAPSDPVD